ncbi:MAG: hypothetical protein ABF289_06545 [Clostridiales bacterium]
MKKVKTTIYLTEENSKLLKKVIYLDDTNRRKQLLLNEALDIGLKKIESDLEQK